MLGKLICFVTRKHKRGKRVDSDTNNLTRAAATGTVAYKCPRCGARWERKTRKPKEQPSG